MMALISNPKLFPTVMAALSLLASASYYLAGWSTNWRMVLYWGAAAIITTVVTW